MKVIRIIQYEGDEAAVRTAIRQSKQLGVHEFNDYTLTIVEHLNELPPLVKISDDHVNSLVKTATFLNILDK